MSVPSFKRFKELKKKKKVLLRNIYILISEERLLKDLV